MIYKLTVDFAVEFVLYWWAVDCVAVGNGGVKGKRGINE